MRQCGRSCVRLRPGGRREAGLGPPGSGGRREAGRLVGAALRTVPHAPMPPMPHYMGATHPIHLLTIPGLPKVQ